MLTTTASAAASGTSTTRRGAGRTLNATAAMAAVKLSAQGNPLKKWNNMKIIGAACTVTAPASDQPSGQRRRNAAYANRPLAQIPTNSTSFIAVQVSRVKYPTTAVA